VEIYSHAPTHLERHRICTEVAQLWDGAHLTDPCAPRRLAPAGYRLRPGIAPSFRHDWRCRWHGERGKALRGGQQGEVKVMRQERMADGVPWRPLPLCAASKPSLTLTRPCSSGLAEAEPRAAGRQRRIPLSPSRAARGAPPCRL
jgi:hypothetical protein